VISGPTDVLVGDTGLVYAVAPIAGASSYQWTLPATWALESGQGSESITVTAGLLSGDVEVHTVNVCDVAGPPQALSVTAEALLTVCTAAGGSYEAVQDTCYFSGASCPTSWTQTANYTSTQVSFCNGVKTFNNSHAGCGCLSHTCGSTCFTTSHVRAATPVETCSYSVGQGLSCSYCGCCGGGCHAPGAVNCLAAVVEIGCTPD
jgi:hypothetical protein